MEQSKTLKPVKAYKFCCNVYESYQNLLCSIAKVNEQNMLLCFFIYLFLIYPVSRSGKIIICLLRKATVK